MARTVMVLCALAGFTSVAHAQWTVVYLHPAGATNSRVHGSDGGRQVGYAVFGTSERASLWSGSAESRVDASPAAGGGGARAVSGTLIIGIRQSHAAVWTPGGASVDLNPPESTESSCEGGDAEQQVGHAFHDATRASLWTGSAASWVNLHPPGA